MAQIAFPCRRDREASWLALEERSAAGGFESNPHVGREIKNQEVVPKQNLIGCRRVFFLQHEPSYNSFTSSAILTLSSSLEVAMCHPVHTNHTAVLVAEALPRMSSNSLAIVMGRRLLQFVAFHGDRLFWIVSVSNLQRLR